MYVVICAVISVYVQSYLHSEERMKIIKTQQKTCVCVYRVCIVYGYTYTQMDAYAYLEYTTLRFRKGKDWSCLR